MSIIIALEKEIERMKDQRISIAETVRQKSNPMYGLSTDVALREMIISYQKILKEIA